MPRCGVQAPKLSRLCPHVHPYATLMPTPHPPITLCLPLWMLAYGLWLMASGAWLLAYGSLLMARGSWPMTSGMWLLAPGLWLLALWLLALWLLASGSCPLACGLWLVACGIWPVAIAIMHPITTTRHESSLMVCTSHTSQGLCQAQGTSTRTTELV